MSEIRPVGKEPNPMNEQGGDAKPPGGRSLAANTEVPNPGIAGDARKGKYTGNTGVRGPGGRIDGGSSKSDSVVGDVHSKGEAKGSRRVDQASSDQRGETTQGRKIVFVSDSSDTTNGKEETSDNGRQGNSEGFVRPSEDRRPEAPIDRGGDEPPIDGSSSNTGAEFSENGPKRDLEGIFHYLNEAQGGAENAANAALKEGISITPSSEKEDSLAEFDKSSTVTGRLEFDQELVATQYHETLDRAGLKFGKNIFSPELIVVDGQRFADTLSAVPEGSERLNKGLENIVENVFMTIRDGHVRGRLDSTSFRHPALHPQITESPDNLGAYSEATTAMLEHGNSIADQLQRLDVKDTTVTRLRAASLARQEGMVPEWAITEQWDLYKPPTTNVLASQWNYFDANSWQNLHEFLDNAVAQAPKNSQFIGHLARTMQTNIHKLRSGIFLPGEPTEPGYDATAETSEFAVVSLAGENDSFITSLEQKLLKILS